MEFETDHSDSSSDISDEMRLEASARQRILEPLHTDIAPNEESDELIASEHINTAPIANLPTDSEHTTAYTDPTPTQRHPLHRGAFIISLSVVVALICLVVYLMLTI